MSIKKTLLLTSIGVLVVGVAGYFLIPRGHWAFYFFAHLGALGVMGLSGSLAGALADWKSRSFVTGFAIGAILPIVVGLTVVFGTMWGVEGQVFCGGSVCLGTSLLIAVAYLLVTRKTVKAAA